MTSTQTKLLTIGRSARFAAAGVLVVLWFWNLLDGFSPAGGRELLCAAGYSLAAGFWAWPLIRRFEHHFGRVLIVHFTADVLIVFWLVSIYGAPWQYHLYAITSLTIIFTSFADKPASGLYLAAMIFIMYLVAMTLFPVYRRYDTTTLVFEALFVAGYLVLISVVAFYAKRTVDAHREEAEKSTVALEHANQQLRQRMLDLARSDRYKSEFLHMVSHELRTPLNSIIGFSDLMLKGLEGPISPAQREDLESIHRSGRYLLAIVNDILDMAKIQSGDLRLSPERCDVASLARESAEVLVPAYSSKGLSLEISGPSGQTVPLMVEADPSRIRQVFFNLLSNAVKFTDHGGVRVMFSQENGHIICSVSDTGRGIPSDRIEEVFDPFKQVDASSNRKNTGTGLGLPISKRLVELHGGTIRVRSQVGRGTTFEFTIPRNLPPEAPRKQ